MARVVAAVVVLLVGCSMPRTPILPPSGSSSDRHVLGSLARRDAGANAISTLAGNAGKLEDLDAGADVLDAGELEPLDAARDAGKLEPLDAGELEAAAADAGDAGELHAPDAGTDAGPRNACGGRFPLPSSVVGSPCAGPLACSAAPPAAVGCWTCVTTEQLSCCNCAP